MLALFMLGHTLLVGSILAGERGFDWMATTLEDLYIAQPTVLVIFVLFLLHAVSASRKIPAQLAERRRMIELGKNLARAGRDRRGNPFPDLPAGGRRGPAPAFPPALG